MLVAMKDALGLKEEHMRDISERTTGTETELNFSANNREFGMMWMGIFCI
jgi:hypothetical protein